MYREYFGFERKPFSIAPDPRFLYMSQRHREALAHLLYGVGEGGGFVQLTGEVGTGKTTVCRCLLEQLPENVDVALILNPKLSATELVATVCDELKIPYPGEGASLKTLIDSLNRHLLVTHARGRRTVLLIDEAQNLSTEVLEQVRLLTNLETTEEKLLQIILIGQPELNEILDLHKMRQLAQRVTARYHLQALDRDETADYIDHRLRVCGANRNMFNKRAVDEIHRLSGGIPRLINILCDRALLGAYVEDKQTVDGKIVDKAAREVGVRRQAVKETAGGKKSILPWVAGILACLGVAWMALELWPETDRELQAVAEPGSRSADAPAEPVAESKDAPVPPPAGSLATAATSVPAVTADVPPATILSGLVEDADAVSPGAAARGLLRAWGVEDPGTAPVCDSAQRHGLTCLSGRASWSMLRGLDRPAILRLRVPDLASAHVVLVGLSDTDATFATGDGRTVVQRSEVEKYWDGDYTLLWRSPIEARSLKPGERSEEVAWLRRQLGAAMGELPASGDPRVFDATLAEQVRRFQGARGLEQDGIVGRHTLIHLNSIARGNRAPRLGAGPA